MISLMLTSRPRHCYAAVVHMLIFQYLPLGPLWITLSDARNPAFLSFLFPHASVKLEMDRRRGAHMKEWTDVCMEGD